jgi:atypical dual specificity phosphatase
LSGWFRTYGFEDVQDELIIGAYPLDEEDVGMLQWVGVQKIVNLVEDSEYRPGARNAVERAIASVAIEERRWGMPDYGHLPVEQLEGAVADVVSWLDEGRCVYLHCRAGWQRSAAVAAAVVAIREGVDIQEALARVQRRKPSAEPLSHQREDLERWWAERKDA